MMQNTWKKSWMLCLGLVIFLHACKDEELDNPNQPLSIKSGVGRLKANPFSFESMSDALDEIKDTNLSSVANSLNLQLSGPTSLYVRFTPQTEDQYQALESEFGVEIFSEPLDADFLDESYTEPPLPHVDASHYYTTVDIGYQFTNGVPYEILYEAYLPLEDEALVNQFLQDREQNNLFEDDDYTDYPCELLTFANDLESTSLINNGFPQYVDDYSCNPGPGNTGGNEGGSGNTGTTNSYPSTRYGRITVDDDYLGTIPLEGVKVTTSRFLSTKVAYTDVNGYYRKHSNHIDKKCRYWIKFERYDFLIRRKGWRMAKIKGPKQKSLWNHHIAIDTEHNYWATVFRAAYHYYHKNVMGLRRPPQNSFFKRQLKIKVYWGDDEGSTHRNTRYIFGIASDIKHKRSKRDTRGVYANAIHEIAHAAHWSMDKSSYRNMNDCSDTALGLYCSGDQEVVETWARGVEWALTNMVYEPVGAPWRPSYNRPRYTGLVEDLVDGVKTRTNNNIWNTENDNSLTYEDRAENYTIRQIEDALIGVTEWSQWQQRIFNLYPNNPSRIWLDEAFAFWRTTN